MREDRKVWLRIPSEGIPDPGNARGRQEGSRMHAVSRASDRRDIGPQLHRSARTVDLDRRDHQGQQGESDCRGRRSRALLMLAPIFGLTIWGALIALAI